MELLSIVLCVAALLLTSIFGLTLWITNEHYREAIARSLATPAENGRIKQRQPPQALESSRLQMVVNILKEMSSRPFPVGSTAENVVIQALTLMQSEAGSTQNSRRIATYILYKRLFNLDGTEVGHLDSTTVMSPAWGYSNLYTSHGNVLRPSENCPICWDSITPTQRSVLHGQCRHSFHPECLERYHQNAPAWICPFDKCVVVRRRPPVSLETFPASVEGIARAIRGCQESLQAGTLDIASAQRLLLRLEYVMKRHLREESIQPPNAPLPAAQIQAPNPAQQPALDQQRLIRIPQPVRPAVPATPQQQVQPPQPAAPRQIIAPHQQPDPAVARPAVPVLANPHVQIARPLVQAQPRAGPATPAQQPIRPAGIAQRPSIGAAGRAVQAIDRAPQNHAANRPQANRQPKPKPPRPAWR